MYFILLVLNNVEMMEDVLEAWEIAGAKGVTILPSIGFAKIKDKRSLQEDFPLIPGLDDIIETGQNQNRTLFTIVGSEEIKEDIIVSTQKITGDLNNPYTGILVVMPVSQAFGLDRW